MKHKLGESYQPKRWRKFLPAASLVLAFGMGSGLMYLFKPAKATPPVVVQAAEPKVEPVEEEISKTQKSIILDVPSLRQTYRQSCEAASLRMALQYRGVETDDMTLLKLFGYDPSHRDTVNNTWDNPYEQFVGDVTGAQDKGEGYGVYATAVVKAEAEVGRKLLAIKDIEAEQLAGYLYDGNPVVIWGYYNADSKADSWETVDGTVIPAVIKAHVRLVVGVKGPAGKPTGFYVHDPLIVSAKPTLWSTAKMMDNLKKFGAATDQGVVVF